MKCTIYIVEDETDARWVESNFGYNAGDSCKIAAHDYGYGNFGVRVHNGQFCGYGRLSFYTWDNAYKDSEFVEVKDAASSWSENDCAFKCNMSDLIEV